jgi:hypothetical protein
MRPASNTSVRGTNVVLALLAAGLMIHSPAVPAAWASEAMPVARQNELVQMYCAVCHTDAVRNGGLSLEHFDAARADPSLAAVMVSKLTSGVLLETVKAASYDPAAAALVARKMKGGAMGAAGLPVPDKATIDALIGALTSEATGADRWHVSRSEGAPTKTPVFTASILRELPSATKPGEASLYRLVLSCNAATRKGEMQLAWAPSPKTGTLSGTVDGNIPFAYKVEGTEHMGNGSQVTAGPAAITLYDSGKLAQTPGMVLPRQVLLVRNLFPEESVEFPFGDLTQAARQSLRACFRESNAGQ